MPQPPDAQRTPLIRVMLVDDHPVVRDGYRRILENSADIRVVAEAGDGETACALYAEYAPDVVILDLSMPGIGGMETLRRLKAKEAKDTTARILVFTMFDDETLIQRTLEAGALGYLNKQGGVTQMVTAVRLVAAGKSYIDSQYVTEIACRKLEGHASPLQQLTPREFQIFQLLAEGHSVATIAQLLSLSPKTVGVHHANIMHKLRIENTAQLVRLAIRCHVVQL